MLPEILKHWTLTSFQHPFFFYILNNNFANDKKFSNLDKPDRFKHTLCHVSTCEKDKCY